MKKSTRTVIIIFALLIIATVPIYLYMRQSVGSKDSLQIKGAVSNPLNMTYSFLKTLTPVTVQVTLTSSKTPADNGVFNFTGIPLSILFEQVQICENVSSVYVQAADGYGITVPIEDVLHNEQAIVAYERNGEPLKSITEGGDGPFRLIIGTDEYAQRWIRGVAVIEVR
ncbi:MAG: molybdopterin-dependent oxidoreductase [Candidatus Bathyarchaeia archaeon]|jgi:DMSO/TMAO reductase YedYZ molybdopterin-dependent catalytic subunit